jgi:hypothetical protein
MIIKVKRTKEFNRELKLNMLIKGYNADQFFRKFNLDKSSTDQILFRSRYINLVEANGVLDLIKLELKVNGYELEILDTASRD